MTYRRTSMLGVLILLLATSSCRRVREELVALQNPFPRSSPLHSPFDRMSRKLVNDPRYVETMRGTGSPEAALLKGSELSLAGLQRLDDATLERRLELLSGAMGVLDEPACALLAAPDPANPKATGDALMSGLAKLPQAQIDAWFDLSLRSTLAGLGDDMPVRTADPAATQAALKMLVERLPETEKSRILQTLPRLRQASRQDKCWVGRALFSKTLKLPEPQRGALARALASPG